MDAKRANDLATIVFAAVLVLVWGAAIKVVFEAIFDGSPEIRGQYQGYPPYAQPPGCSFEHGGEMGACQRLMQRYPEAGEQGQLFSSFGVMALKHARCIQPGSIWRFHGAYLAYPGSGASGPPDMGGSELMRRSIARYPRLRSYLDAHRVWSSGGGPPLALNAQQMNALGVPICGY